MSKKWEQFHHEHFDTKDSGIDPTQSDTNSPSTQPDWYREAKTENSKVFINGEPLSTFSKVYNDFRTDEDVESFFKNVILKKVNASVEEKNMMVQYLMKNFHQGGHMYPLASALGFALIPTFSVNSNGRDSTINIQLTEKGFKVEDFTKFTSLLVLDEELAEKRKDRQFVNPPAGLDYVVKAQATLDLDFSKNPAKPSLTVESNAITYADEMIKKRLDNRDLLHIIVDFFKKVIGLNEVKVNSISREHPDAVGLPKLEEVEHDQGQTLH